MNRRISRRLFLEHTALAGIGFWVGANSVRAAMKSPNEKLNIGVIGVAGRGAANLAGVSGENIVALCDIDDRNLGKAAERFSDAKTYNDFRKLLDQREVEAVVISTADHCHAAATVAAMKLGKHVYCEKPLTHTIHEARVVAETAAKSGVATQMGTQIHAGNNYRRVVELVRSGAIGHVRECHVWVGKSWGGGDRPTETPPVPEHIHYDLWLGPAPERPYHPAYLPNVWRRWWDFGGGTLADMGCHYIDLVHWSLDLRHPISAEAEGPPVYAESAPAWLIVNYQYPARGDKPPVRVTWYDGGKRPPHFDEGKLPKWGDGVLFVGEKGMLIADYNRHKLLPESDFADFVPPEPTIPQSIGHHAEWIAACKTGSDTLCNFDYAGALTESVLLGIVAYRTGKRIEWDSRRLKATNCPEADQFVAREYRKGWTL